MNQSERLQNQMYFDGDHDNYGSFLGEVIQILRPDRIHIDIANDGSRPIERRVRIEFVGTHPDQGEVKTVQFGHSYGEALRLVREHIRFTVGR